MIFLLFTYYTSTQYEYPPSPFENDSLHSQFKIPKTALKYGFFGKLKKESTKGISASLILR